MNPNTDNHEPTSVEDLHDRLMDRALAEVVGGEVPPDLSSRILPAHQPSSHAAEAAGGRRSGRSLWISLAVAATLLIAAAPLFWSAVMRSQLYTAQNNPHIAVTADDRQSTAATSFESVAKPDPTGSEVPGSGRGRRGRGANANFDELIETIESTVATDSFDGGEVKKNEFFPNLSVVISQSQRVLDEGEQSGQGPPREFDLKAVPESLHQRVPPTGTVEIPRFTSDMDIPFRQNSFELAEKPAGLPTDSDGDGILHGYGVADDVALLVEQDEVFHVNGQTVDGELQLMVRPRIVVDGKAKDVLPGNQPLRPDKKTDLGTGPGLSGDQYTRIYENPFVKAEGGAAVSTFSIDVDTASYTNVRRFLLTESALPPPDAVRIEELVNYFKYDYAPPAKTPADGGTGEKDDADSKPAPFAAHIEVAGCPWAPDHRLVRIGIKGFEMDRRERPKSNLVFLVDVSGSMNEPSKLPLVIDGLRELTRELGENDRVAIVVYAQQEGLVLPSTPGSDHAGISAALSQLRAGGSTAGGAGIQLAYQIAEDNFIEGGTNRVILCTDGDFNVGTTSTAELERFVEQKAKDTGVFLSVLGFGRGNLNDQMMEAISNRGNGNYSYVDGLREARRMFVEEMSGTLVTIAKDVKIQVEFNPQQAAGYRLLGYENRMLRTEDFNDDTKDAGEIGAGHTVTALYEVVPAGKPIDLPPVDELKYQRSANRSRLSDEEQDTAETAADISRELLTLKMKYKQPDADTSEDALEWPVTDEGAAFSAASNDFQFASAVAGFGMLLRDSQHKGNLTYAAVLELAEGGVGADANGYRSEFVDMVRRAKQLRGE